MKIISLSSSIAGPACAVAYCIKNFYYNNNYQTNFFDNLEISLISVNEILQTNNITDILTTNNLIVLNKDNKNSVYFNNFNKLISHHDLVKNYNNEDYNDVINKYKRRYYRLIDTIKNEDIIFFIRYGNEQYNDILYFMERIKIINPNLKPHFINVNFDENENCIQKNYNITNYNYINFYNYFDNSIQYNEDLYYKTIQFNWLKVFQIINNLLTTLS